MLDVQVTADRRWEIEEAHRDWTASLPREPGQIGGTASSMMQGPPVTISGRIQPYSDFTPVRFMSVDPRFIEFMIQQGIAADIIEGDTVHTISAGINNARPPCEFDRRNFPDRLP